MHHKYITIPYTRVIIRASIDLEPKIRTIGKNMILLPKKNQTFFQKKFLY